MEWLDLINSLRKELDHLEVTLPNHNPPLRDETKLMVVKGFITTFADDLYPDADQDDD